MTASIGDWNWKKLIDARRGECLFFFLKSLFLQRWLCFDIEAIWDKPGASRCDDFLVKNSGKFILCKKTRKWKFIKLFLVCQASSSFTRLVQDVITPIVNFFLPLNSGWSYRAKLSRKSQKTKRETMKLFWHTLFWPRNFNFARLPWLLHSPHRGTSSRAQTISLIKYQARFAYCLPKAFKRNWFIVII